jgi:hypothetical protein
MLDITTELAHPLSLPGHFITVQNEFKPTAFTALAKTHAAAQPTNIPPAPASKWNLLVVNLTTPGSAANVDATIDHVVASIGKQITRDFEPIWGVTGALSVDNHDVWTKMRKENPGGPVDSDSPDVAGEVVRRVVEGQVLEGIDWRTTGIVYLTDGQSDFGGVHVDIQVNTNNDIPYALVGCTDSDWSVVFSHEVLELLGDPYGKRMATRKSVRQLWIVEVCDPPEDTRFAYDIDGVKASDFLLPQYFNEKTTDKKLSFRGNITHPFTIREGGYLSYLDLRDNRWKQITWFGGSGPKVVTLSASNDFEKVKRSAALATHKHPNSFYRLRKYMNHVNNLNKIYPDLSVAFRMH